jgi:hypothetical protein
MCQIESGAGLLLCGFILFCSHSFAASRMCGETSSPPDPELKGLFHYLTSAFKPLAVQTIYLAWNGWAHCPVSKDIGQLSSLVWQVYQSL